MSNSIRWTDESVGFEFLKAIQRAESGAWISQIDGECVYLENFDEPLVAQTVNLNSKFEIELTFPYGFESTSPLAALKLDEWDRFCGLTHEKVSFVLSRKAQFQFFELLEDHSDDSFFYNGVEFFPKPPFLDNSEASVADFWSELYEAAFLQGDKPRWDLGTHHPALDSLSAQIKIPRCRVAVLGSGRAHDAAFFAKQGHIVTAFDMSEVALKEAQKLYSHLPNLKLEKMDLFALPQKFDGKFDLIFDHTCFCAVEPSRREELVKIWRRMLAPQGQVLGIFFVFNKSFGPPYGSSEWELKQRFQSHFRSLYWTRWKFSPKQRQGTELVVFMDKV